MCLTSILVRQYCIENKPMHMNDTAGWVTNVCFMSRIRCIRENPGIATILIDGDYYWVDSTSDIINAIIFSVCQLR